MAERRSFPQPNYERTQT